MSEVLMRVTAVDYTTEDDQPMIQLAGRDAAGERRSLLVEDSIPYFYARRDEVAQIESHGDVRQIEDGYESFDGIPLSRIDVRVPNNVGSNGSAPNLTTNFDETFEADIPYHRRISIDYGLSGHIRVPDTDRCSIEDIDRDVSVTGSDEIDPRICIADIEVLNLKGVSYDEMTEEYNCPVSHITMWDSKVDEYVCLYLDPEGEVSPGDVDNVLRQHIDAESVSDEVDRGIHLRRYESEEKLLSGFIATMMERRFDLVSGWNWVDFDWDYLLNRIENVDPEGCSAHDLSDIGYASGYQTERRIDCLPAFDMMRSFVGKISKTNWRSSALDYVAKEELGVGKLESPSITWAYENDRSTLTAYNIVDTMLCVALDRKEGVHEFFYELAELAQVQIYDTMSEMRLIDGYLMSRTDDDEILPSIDDKDIPENAGGLVLNPSDGVKDWVGVIDLKSLYPSTIITWNISPETVHWYDDEQPSGEYIDIPWLPDVDDAEGGDFGSEEIDTDVMWSSLEEEGLIPKYLKRLFPERAEKKEKRAQYDPDDPMYDVWDRKQFAVKVVMNAFYGVMSMDYWRLAQYGLGDSVTSAARFALWKGKEITESEGYNVYYGDTDAVMISLAEEDESKETALDRGHELEETINGRMDECVVRSGLDGDHPLLTEDLHGTNRHCLSYEFEKLLRRFFQAGSKKRYAGLKVWVEGQHTDPDIDMVGFESQRSDSPELTEEVQPEIVERVLSGDEFEDISEYVRGLITDIEDREIDPYRVALPSTINDPLEQYGNTQTARACRYGNRILDQGWRQGDDPWVYFTKKTPPLEEGTDVIALEWGDDIPEGFKLDLDETVRRAIKQPIEPVIDEVGWRWDDIEKGAQTDSAADWDASGYEAPEPDESENEAVGWGW